MALYTSIISSNMWTFYAQLNVLLDSLMFMRVLQFFVSCCYEY